MAWTPTRLRANVRTYLRAIEEPSRVECAEHGAGCDGALRQCFALVVRVGEGTEEQVGIVVAEGHDA